MKIYILFLFFFPLSAFAQHKNVQQFYLEFNGNEKSKTLSVSCETGACDLFLDSDSIGTVWAYVSTADKMISCLTAPAVTILFSFRHMRATAVPRFIKY